MIRVFDFVFAVLGLIVLSPLLLFIAILIKFDSKGPVIYRQERIGLNGEPFKLFKFRTMYTKADKGSLLTIGDRDKRITRCGRFLRKYKLDELPQLFNVLINDMSIVGPRPEVKKYVDLYTDEQKQVLNVKPGITDYASIKYKNENELLAATENPEQEYINIIMPEKIQLNIRYIQNPSIKEYFTVIAKTIQSILK